MNFLVNNSPLAGSEGKGLTRITLYERLRQECENNVSLKLELVEDNVDAFKSSGRGELQLGVLIETIRREGYELAVSPPQVIFKTDSLGNREEPIEEVIIDCDSEFSGVVIEKLSKRKAELVKMTDATDGKCRMVFKCPTRGLIGYASELKNDTKGTGILNHSLFAYEAYKGPVESSRRGCLISMSDGSATGYSLADLESRGTLFVSPGAKIYSGMVIGETSRSLDMEVNPCKAKILTNMRSSVKEEFYRLSPARIMSLEDLISYMTGKL
jgi:GTP-binding protein